MRSLQQGEPVPIRQYGTIQCISPVDQAPCALKGRAAPLSVDVGILLGNAGYEGVDERGQGVIDAFRLVVGRRGT